jgi:hypothetical protein
MVSDPVGLILRVMAGKNITREDLVPEVGSRSALEQCSAVIGKWIWR